MRVLFAADKGVGIFRIGNAGASGSLTAPGLLCAAVRTAGCAVSCRPVAEEAEYLDAAAQSGSDASFLGFGLMKSKGEAMQAFDAAVA